MNLDKKSEKDECIRLEHADLEHAARDQASGYKGRYAHIRKKLDRRLLPLITALYLISYLDRGNIGNAFAAGLPEDLQLSDKQLKWVLYAFYIVYTCLEWSIIFWKVFPAHIYCSILALGWSVAAMCSGAVTSFGGIVACRAVLGLCEAAFGAGAVYFLTLFYNRNELGVRLSLVLGTSPLANTFASALAYGVMHIRNSIEPWRLLFIIEGAPALLVIPLVYFLLPDSPGTAKFFSESEKSEAIDRLQQRDQTAKSKISGKQYLAGLGDIKNWAHAAMHFCCNYSFAGLSNFLPTIVDEMGFSSVNAQGVIAPVYLSAFLLSMVAAWLSDRYATRGYFVSGFAAVGCVGYLLLALLDGMGPRYAGVWLAACGVFPALALNVTWLFGNQGGETKKGAGFAILTTIGQCSSFISSSLYPDSAAPKYVAGSAVGCGLTGVIVIISSVLHFALARENRRRNRTYGPVDPEATVDVTSNADGNHLFRYLT